MSGRQTVGAFIGNAEIGKATIYKDVGNHIFNKTDSKTWQNPLIGVCSYLRQTRIRGIRGKMIANTMSEADTLRTQLNESTKTAMKEKDKLRVSTLRLISAAIKDRDIAARAEDRCDGIEDSEILSLLAKMVKQRKESAKTYEDNGRPELAERERDEIEIIREFMPKPLSEDEMKTVIADIVESTGATCLKDMGKIMGQLKSGYAGRIDMGKAGAVVKAHLCNIAD